MGSLGEVPRSAQPVTLNSLAAEISELSAKFTKYLEQNNVPAPTFDADSPKRYDNLTAESFMIRQHLLDKINDMWYLTQGPSESIFNYVHSAIPDAAVMNTLNYFDFWSAVPLNGTSSSTEISHHTGLPKEVVERVLDHATTLRLFSYADGAHLGGPVCHTARSAAMAQSPGLRALVSTVLDEAGAPMMVMHEALDKYSRGREDLTQNPTETSFAHLHSKGGGRARYANSWDMLENDGEGDRKGWRHKNFVEFMRYLKDIFRFDDVVAAALDWAALGSGARVVDVGGSAGHDAASLARRFPNLRLTVQDLPRVGPVFDAGADDADLRAEGRVGFVAHDFFEPQPVAGADVYMLKMILHDWTDAECARILRALVPALKPGARVILIEYMGGGDEGAQQDLPRSIRTMGTATDLRLMALFNARERPVGAWKGLLAAADERFKVVSVRANPGEFFAVIEAIWAP